MFESITPQIGRKRQETTYNYDVVETRSCLTRLKGSTNLALWLTTRRDVVLYGVTCGDVVLKSKVFVKKPSLWLSPARCNNIRFGSGTCNHVGNSWILRLAGWLGLILSLTLQFRSGTFVRNFPLIQNREKHLKIVFIWCVSPSSNPVWLGSISAPQAHSFPAGPLHSIRIKSKSRRTS